MTRTTKWLTLTLALLLGSVPAFAATPAIGQKAPDFTLSTPDGHALSLYSTTRGGPVVLVVLRGYPGYQCPYCVRQVHDFVESAASFAAAGTDVVLVYPGPPASLDEHAKEFLAKQNPLPRTFISSSIPITNLQISMDSAGMLPPRPPIRRPSSSTATMSSFRAGSLVAMATVQPQPMSWRSYRHMHRSTEALSV